jgi:hypothetical protein
MFSLFISIYFFFCFIVAFLGKKTELGFLKSLTLATITTPVIAIVLIFIFFPAKISALPKKYRESFKE